MKRFKGQLSYQAVFAAMAMLFAFVVAAVPSPSLAAPPDSGAMAGGPKIADVETRIKELHSKLKITPAQEEMWNKAAQTMRDNAKTMEDLIKARSEKAGAMTAVDDLKSYGEISRAHADAIDKFIPVFEPLYASMSDAQKKDADKLFSRRYGGMKPGPKGKAK